MKKKLLIVIILLILIRMVLYTSDYFRETKRTELLDGLKNNEVMIDGLGSIHSEAIQDIKYTDKDKNKIVITTNIGSFKCDLTSIKKSIGDNTVTFLISEYDFSYNNSLHEVFNDTI